MQQQKVARARIIEENERKREFETISELLLLTIYFSFKVDTYSYF